MQEPYCTLKESQFQWEAVQRSRNIKESVKFKKHVNKYLENNNFLLFNFLKNMHCAKCKIRLGCIFFPSTIMQLEYTSNAHVPQMPFSFQIEESFLLGGVEGGRDRVELVALCSCLPIILYCRYINMNVQWPWINYTHFKSQKETYLSHFPQFLFFVQHWNRNIQHYC